jgi:hypothetical protein
MHTLHNISTRWDRGYFSLVLLSGARREVLEEQAPIISKEITDCWPAVSSGATVLKA